MHRIGIDLAHGMAFFAGVALAAKESLLAIEALPGEQAKKMHEAVTERL